MDICLADSRSLLIKEVHYRTRYRGTLELDMILLPLKDQFDAMSDEDLVELRDFLLNGENNLMAWLAEGANPPERWQNLVEWIRQVFAQSKVKA